MSYFFKFLVAALMALALSTQSALADKGEANPTVLMQTSSGKIIIELFPKQAPITVANFLQYVDEGFYNGTIFHRVAPGFVIQGGGLTFDFQYKTTRDPIKNESNKKLKNTAGTLSMARTSDIDSANSQFFINIEDNKSLDTKSGNTGYAVFGRVLQGMDVVEKIAKQPRGLHRAHPEAPNYPVIIESVSRQE